MQFPPERDHSASGEVYLFGAFELNPDRGTLLKNGVEIPLRHQCFEVLKYLVEHHGTLVTKQELMDAIWTDVIVSESSLPQCILAIRRALDDDSKTLLRLMPRSGYLLDIPVTIQTAPSQETLVFSPAPAAARSHLSWPVAAVLLLTFVIFVDVSSTEQPGASRAQQTKTDSANPYAPDENTRPREQEPLVALGLNPEALRQYQLGKYFQSRRASGDSELAIRQFRSAVEIDPGFAAAWVGLAGSLWVYSHQNSSDSQILRQEMLYALEKTLELDPDNPEANARIAAYYHNRGQLELSGQHFDRALKFGQDNPMVLSFSAGIAFDDHNYPEAIAYQQQAVALDPLSYVNHANLAAFLKSAGRLDESIQAFQAALELNPNADEEFLTDFLQTYILIGQPDQAEAIALQLIDGSARQQSLAMVYLATGSPARSRQMIEQLKAEPDIESALRVAEYYAFSGDFDGSFQWLDQARHRQSGMDSNLPTCIYFEEILHSPFLQRLTGDPRWNDWQEYVQDQALNQASDTAVAQLNG